MAFFYRTPMVAASGFRGSKYLFQLNLVCIGDNRIGFCPGLLWKQELNLRSSHCSFPIKKMVLGNVVKFTEKHLYWSLILVELQAKRLKHKFSCGVYEIFKTRSLAWNLFSTQSNICDGASLEKIVNSWYYYNQKQSSGGVLQKRCSYKLYKIHRKTPALEYRF